MVDSVQITYYRASTQRIVLCACIFAVGYHFSLIRERHKILCLEQTPWMVATVAIAQIFQIVYMIGFACLPPKCLYDVDKC